MQLTDKVALVTGASRGLGAALSRALCERGARVALVARGHDALSATVLRLRAEGHDAHGFTADIADKEAIYPLIGRVQGTLGEVDLLIHNASTLGPVPLRSLFETDCETFEEAVQTNLLGPFRLSKALAPGMLLRGRGAIVHISSDAAVNAYADWGAYGTSKAALDQLARQLAAELEGSAVHVLTFDPGEMDTAMHRAALPAADPKGLADPQRVAEHIVELLASDLGPLHGHRLVVEATKGAA